MSDSESQPTHSEEFLNDEKTHGAINIETFKSLIHITDQLLEFTLVRPENEQREPKRVGVFLLQYAKQIILELYVNFFRKFCDADKYDELKMDTDSLYLALSQDYLEDDFIPIREASGMWCVRQIAQTLSLWIDQTFLYQNVLQNTQEAR